MNYLWLIKYDDLKMNLGHHQTETKFPTCRFLPEIREIQIEKGKNILANNFSLYSSSNMCSLGETCVTFNSFLDYPQTVTYFLHETLLGLYSCEAKFKLDFCYPYHI